MSQVRDVLMRELRQVGRARRSAKRHASTRLQAALRTIRREWPRDSGQSAAAWSARTLADSGGTAMVATNDASKVKRRKGGGSRRDFYAVHVHGGRAFDRALDRLHQAMHRTVDDVAEEVLRG